MVTINKGEFSKNKNFSRKNYGILELFPTIMEVNETEGPCFKNSA